MIKQTGARRLQKVLHKGEATQPDIRSLASRATVLEDQTIPFIREYVAPAGAVAGEPLRICGDGKVRPIQTQKSSTPFVVSADSVLAPHNAVPLDDNRAAFCYVDGGVFITVVKYDPDTNTFTESSSPQQLSTGTLFGAIALLDKDKVVMYYHDASGDPKARVATISDTVITLGAEASLDATTSISASYYGIAVLTPGLVVFLLTIADAYLQAASISGTTITPGNAVNTVFFATRCSINAQSQSQGILIGQDTTTTFDAMAFSVSGTTITLGPSRVIDTALPTTAGSMIPAVVGGTLVVPYLAGSNIQWFVLVVNESTMRVYELGMSTTEGSNLWTDIDHLTIGAQIAFEALSNGNYALMLWEDTTDGVIRAIVVDFSRGLWPIGNNTVSSLGPPTSWNGSCFAELSPGRCIIFSADVTGNENRAFFASVGDTGWQADCVAMETVNPGAPVKVCIRGGIFNPGVPLIPGAEYCAGAGKLVPKRISQTAFPEGLNMFADPIGRAVDANTLQLYSR